MPLNETTPIKFFAYATDQTLLQKYTNFFTFTESIFVYQAL